MDEPKRRARRAQLEQQAMPESPIAEQPVRDAGDAMPDQTPPRRRRQRQSEPMPPAQPDRIERRKPADKKKRAAAEFLLGASVLLGLAGVAILRAAKRLKREHLRVAAMMLCICVAAVSAWQVGSIVLRSIRTHRLNEELSRQREAIIQTQETMPPEPAAMEALPAAQTQEAEQPQDAAVPRVTAEAVPTAAAPVPTAAIVQDVVKTKKYRQVGGEALAEMAQLYEKNHDLVAWIQIEDVLDLPVVYRNNDYYLTRDFSRQKNASGTIFLDENHPFKEKTQNLLLHGHNMKDRTMFGRLTQYLYDDTYLRNHPFVSFDTLWNREQYVIFAVLDVSLEPSDPRFLNYFTHDTFSSDAEFSMYIRQLQLRSEFAIPIDVEPTDALLTLSTCLDDDRLVIVARRLREGETRSQLRTLIHMATKQ